MKGISERFVSVVRRRLNRPWFGQEKMLKYIVKKHQNIHRKSNRPLTTTGFGQAVDPCCHYHVSRSRGPSGVTAHAPTDFRTVGLRGTRRTSLDAELKMNAGVIGERVSIKATVFKIMSKNVFFQKFEKLEKCLLSEKVSFRGVL